MPTDHHAAYAALLAWGRARAALSDAVAEGRGRRGETDEENAAAWDVRCLADRLYAESVAGAENAPVAKPCADCDVVGTRPHDGTAMCAGCVYRRPACHGTGAAAKGRDHG